MGLNEALRGPASFPDGRPDAATLRRAEALDRLQLAFHERLAERGIEAVAFNFGAGNFTHPDHYLHLFPRTLENYTYLGFHEYGWPTLAPAPAVRPLPCSIAAAWKASAGAMAADIEPSSRRRGWRVCTSIPPTGPAT